jgi:glycosyltransferase involved in cell wall biosynthesis
MKTVSVCITSYNRFDLLKQTVDSLLFLNTYPIQKIVIIEDSTNVDMRDKITSYFGHKIDLIFNDANLGQVRSIYKAYSQIDSEYIFHSEDDYLYNGNANFIQDSIDILEARSDVKQVWLRHLTNYAVSHGPAGITMFEPTVLTTTTNVGYRMLVCPHFGDWCGFSWNPGLRRKSDYLDMFPNGYAEFMQPGEGGVHSEHRCNLYALKNGYRAALLVNGACLNMGHNVSTYK